MSSNRDEVDFKVKAIQIIEENFANPHFRVQRLAHKMNYTREYVSRRFSELHGIPPSTYIQQKRISKASELLCEEPYMKIIHVCHASGFLNHAYFSKSFRLHCGMTPSEWRKGCRKKKQ